MKHVEKLLRGSALNVTDLALKMAVTIVITPLMIHGLDLSGYGLWLLVMSVASYCGLLDLGITFSASRFTAFAIGAGNAASQGEVLGIARQYFRRIGGIILLCSPLVVYLVGLMVVTPDQSKVEIALAIVLLTLAARFFFRLPLVLLRGAMRHDAIASASIIRTFMQSVVLIWLLKVNPSVIGVAVVQAMGETVELGMLCLFSRRINAGVHVETKADGERTQLRRQMRSFAGTISIITVGESLRMQSNPLIVNFHRGLEAVPIYSIGMRLITMLQDVVSAIFGGPVLSIFSHLHGAGENEGLKRCFLRYSEWAAAFAACAVLGSTWLAPAFFHRWVGPKLEDASHVMFIVALPYALHFSQYPAHNLLYSLNKSDYLARLSLIGGAISAVLSFIFGYWWGVHGVVGGLALEMLVSRLLVVPLFVSKVIDMSAWRYLLGHLIWPALKTISLPLLCVWGLREQVRSDYFNLACIGAVFALCSTLSFFLLALQQKDRAAIWQRLTRRK
ncbi:lipopolysaccharide biosynthesis protein [Prosthecobacter sp.]|uniref:lipopolysaccharide biosynthesis protein n=1 Tax=Prosthecobacter sp. TaxID=1965333 RepID=UPI0037847CDE